MNLLLAAIDYENLLTRDNLVPVIRVAVILLVALPLVLLTTRILRRRLKGRVTAQHAMLTAKLFSYITITILLVMALRELGFKLTTLLGAAGIVGVAVGFAAQTSLSNLISGIFLVTEKTFEIGDVIQVGNTQGTVKSVDLLSIKLRTFDNQLIRIPNETLVKTQVSTLTAYGIRRLMIPLRVAHGSDLRQAMALLTQIAEDNPLVLDEPKALVALSGFGESAIELQFGVWFAKANFLKVRDECIIEIHERFREAGIEIPYPQRTLHMVDADAPVTNE